MDIPLIDIAPLAGTDDAARARTAATIGRACRDIGFFAITGHGVAAGAIDDAFRAAHQLFALPAQDKQALSIARHGNNRGYVALGVESLDEKAAPDLKEAFNLVWTDEATRPPNVWPPLPGWRSCMQVYFDAALAVGRRLHEAFALDLGLLPTSSPTSSTRRRPRCAFCTTRPNSPPMRRRARPAPAPIPTTAT